MVTDELGGGFASKEVQGKDPVTNSQLVGLYEKVQIWGSTVESGDESVYISASKYQAHVIIGLELLEPPSVCVCV